VNEPVPVDVPNEIALEHPVSFYILPTYDRLDANTVFRWCLEELTSKDKKDEKKREIVQIPQRIPIGFNVRVMAITSSGHERTKISSMCFRSSKSQFYGSREWNSKSIGGDRGGLDEAARSGNSPWMINRDQNESIDFDYEYPIVPIPEEEEVTIHLKQRKMKVKVSESWMRLRKACATVRPPSRSSVPNLPSELEYSAIRR
jgi:hypothetical protein